MIRNLSIRSEKVVDIIDTSILNYNLEELLIKYIIFNIDTLSFEIESIRENFIIIFDKGKGFSLVIK